jgi:hypothetical protein
MKKLKIIAAAMLSLALIGSAGAQGKKTASAKIAGTTWVYSVPDPINPTSTMMKMALDFKVDSVTMTVSAQGAEIPTNVKYTYAKSKVTILFAEATQNQAKDWVGNVKGNNMEIEISPGMKVTFVKQ